jgi:hypothetical protein
MLQHGIMIAVLAAFAVPLAAASLRRRAQLQLVPVRVRNRRGR